MLFQLVTIFSFLIGAYVVVKNIFLFLEIKKHKRYYFYRIGLGGMYPFKVLAVCVTIKQKDGVPEKLYLVKRGGRIKLLVDLTHAAPPNFQLIRSFLRHTVVRKGRFAFEVGTEDASLTAMLCGALWSVAGTVVGAFIHHFHMHKIHFSVQPIYNKTIFTTYVHCILKIDLVKSIIDYRKYKKKAVKKHASHRKHYASNNE